jgi:hypothetical protein
MRDLGNLKVVGLEGERVCGAGDEKQAEEIALVCPSKNSRLRVCSVCTC